MICRKLIDSEIVLQTIRMSLDPIIFTNSQDFHDQASKVVS